MDQISDILKFKTWQIIDGLIIEGNINIQLFINLQIRAWNYDDTISICESSFFLILSVVDKKSL